MSNREENPPAGLDERERFIWLKGYWAGRERQVFTNVDMTVIDLIEVLRGFPPSALVMIPERD